MLPFLLTAVLAAPAPALPATNAKCPVLGEQVDPKTSPKVAVRGREYYICCKGCGPKITADPDRYLEKDGTPKNAKSK